MDGVQLSQSVNDRNHGLLINVVAALCLSCSLLVYCGRLMIRWPWSALFGRDDAALTAATFLQLVQVVVICTAVSQGLGRVDQDLNVGQASKILKIIFASDVLYISASFLSRVAMALLLLRISTSRSYVAWSKGLVITCVAFAIIDLLIIGAGKSQAAGHRSVDKVMAFWITSAAMSIFLEICIFCFPARLVWDLQMKRTTKLAVMTGFGLRLPVIAFIILRLWTLIKHSGKDDFLFHYPSIEIFTQLEMAYALVSATLPCLRIFLKAAYTGQLGAGVDPTLMSHMATKGSISNWSSDNSRRKSSAVEPVSKVIDFAPHGQTTYSSSAVASITIEDDLPLGNHDPGASIMVKQTVDVKFE